MRGGGWSRIPSRPRLSPGLAAPAAEPPPPLPPRPLRRRAPGTAAGVVSGKGWPRSPGLCRCVEEAWGGSASSWRGKPRSPGRVGGDASVSSVSWRASAGSEGDL